MGVIGGDVNGQNRRTANCAGRNSQRLPMHMLVRDRRLVGPLEGPSLDRNLQSLMKIVHQFSNSLDLIYIQFFIKFKLNFYNIKNSKN